MWNEFEWKTINDLTARMARLEEAVINHIPTRLAAVEQSVNVLHARMWALLVGVLMTALGVWMNYSLLRARIL